jgi:hypothetical protein
MDKRKIYLGLIGAGVWIFDLIYFWGDITIVPYNFSSIIILFVVGLIGTVFIYVGSKLYKK